MNRYRKPTNPIDKDEAQAIDKFLLHLDSQRMSRRRRKLSNDDIAQEAVQFFREEGVILTPPVVVVIEQRLKQDVRRRIEKLIEG